MTAATQDPHPVNHAADDTCDGVMSHPSETLREFQALFETLNREAERNRVRALCRQ